MEEESNNLTESLLQPQEEKESEAEETKTMAKQDPDTPPTTTDVLTTDAVITEDSSSLLAGQTQEWERGEKQPSKCRDVPFALVWISVFFSVAVHGVISFTSGAMGDAINIPTNNENPNVDDIHKFCISSALAVASTIVFIMLSFLVLTRMGKEFITCSVWTSVAISAAASIVSFTAGAILPGVMCLFSAVIGCCYAIAVKNRIPFAAANLNAAVTGIKLNMGIILITLLTGVISFCWMVLWGISLVSASGASWSCPNDTDTDADADECNLDAPRAWLLFPWILFLYWTQQVLGNIVHTTVAGIISTWYFVPAEAAGVFSPAVLDSTKRSLTNSLGSICFGSLLVAIIQFLDFVVQSLRSNGNGGRREQSGVEAVLLCCLDCILSLLQNIMEYFNKWAFVFVGIYGYDFLTAGKKVMTLFTQRGWTVVINDNLISRALALMSFTIAALSAMVSVIFVHFDEQELGPSAFLVNFFIALVLAVTMMNIIDSAVSTVIVCFAEAPMELERNHPPHSRDMKESWHKVYPMVRI